MPVVFGGKVMRILIKLNSVAIFSQSGLVSDVAQQQFRFDCDKSPLIVEPTRLLNQGDVRLSQKQRLTSGLDGLDDISFYYCSSKKLFSWIKVG